uniref:Uncharacterized protein n=1 Tax=Chromera velia CCMP2878 TaxID=1169474 RepID=A0A0G4HA42_9ALVE|eukprot:Cvel_25435.t1-p1 / transcript=Cvel_25435.t1 / gene=Cvel_25435 / organism=Chromera_velia_CCMP2878 / gene_product=hypothetical protein / transcript_product=hypothetical protein / location=Cvel_scaffold2881:6110-11291(+) / protein_length=920 / sequence_SO=supercontig / SO=protein_coding / is_pseudo=false
MRNRLAVFLSAFCVAGFEESQTKVPSGGTAFLEFSSETPAHEPRAVSVYWINLDTSVERREEFEKNNFPIFKKVGGLRPVRVSGWPGNHAEFVRQRQSGASDIVLDCASLRWGGGEDPKGVEKETGKGEGLEGKLEQDVSAVQGTETEEEALGRRGHRGNSARDSLNSLRGFCEGHGFSGLLRVSTLGDACKRAPLPDIGTRLSHLLAMRQAYLRGEEWALFVEDDVSLEPLAAIVDARREACGGRNRSVSGRSRETIYANVSIGEEGIQEEEFTGVTGQSVLQDLIQRAELHAEQIAKGPPINMSDPVDRRKMWGADWSTVDDVLQGWRYRHAAGALGGGKRAVAVQLFTNNIGHYPVLQDLFVNEEEDQDPKKRKEKGKEKGKGKGRDRLHVLTASCKPSEVLVKSPKEAVGGPDLCAPASYFVEKGAHRECLCGSSSHNWLSEMGVDSVYMDRMMGCASWGCGAFLLNRAAMEFHLRMYWSGWRRAVREKKAEQNCSGQEGVNDVWGGKKRQSSVSGGEQCQCERFIKPQSSFEMPTSHWADGSQLGERFVFRGYVPEVRGRKKKRLCDSTAYLYLFPADAMKAVVALSAGMDLSSFDLGGLFQLKKTPKTSTGKGTIGKKISCADVTDQDFTSTCTAAGYRPYDAEAGALIDCGSRLSLCTTAKCCPPPTCASVAAAEGPFDCAAAGYPPLSPSLEELVLCPTGSPSGCTTATCCGPPTCNSAEPHECVSGYECAAIRRNASDPDIQGLQLCPSSDPSACTSSFCCGPATCGSVGIDCEANDFFEPDADTARKLCPNPTDPDSCTPVFCCGFASAELALAAENCTAAGYRDIPPGTTCPDPLDPSSCSIAASCRAPTCLSANEVFMFDTHCDCNFDANEANIVLCPDGTPDSCAADDFCCNLPLSGQLNGVETVRF